MSSRRHGRTARLRVINRSHLDDIDHGKVIHDEDFERFRIWLRERGYPKSKITLAEFKGMMATVDLKPGDTLVSVPRNIMITASDVAKRLGAGHQLDANQLLVLEICDLKRQGTKSSWWPYVKLLPRDFDTMPVTYPSDVLDSAVPHHMQGEIREQRAKIDADYQRTISYMKRAKTYAGVDLTNQEYQWAWLCGSEEKSITGSNIALAPMLDFLNHKCDAKPPLSLNVVTITKPILLISGLLCHIAAVNSAIALDDQMEKLLSRLRASGTLGALKIKLLQDTGDYTIRKDEISFRTLSALRLILAANSAQCTAWERVVMGSQDIISSDIEKQVGQLLTDMCRNTSKQSERALTYLEVDSDLKNSLNRYALLFLKILWKEYQDIAYTAQNELIHNSLSH
ncbi:hypothetical protein INT43_001265 [Umbelopsis isabellina]|uniref:SET domain-containing protein n=1 Tax=Mortierella isabellina TaxID=91625 RepID=A0A8H7PKM6_MORIS|nr:hypothetical protein INT43_001265 [Umbelopsis isabellina]